MNTEWIMFVGVSVGGCSLCFTAGVRSRSLIYSLLYRWAAWVGAQEHAVTQGAQIYKIENDTRRLCALLSRDRCAENPRNSKTFVAIFFYNLASELLKCLYLNQNIVYLSIKCPYVLFLINIGIEISIWPYLLMFCMYKNTKTWYHSEKETAAITHVSALCLSRAFAPVRKKTGRGNCI